MNLKIETGALDSTTALQNSRTEATRAGKGSDAARGSAADGDSVAISDFSTRISDTLSLADAKSADRVTQLAALYARGAYHVDSAKLSRALVDRAMSPEGL